MLRGGTWLQPSDSAALIRHSTFVTSHPPQSDLCPAAKGRSPPKFVICDLSFVIPLFHLERMPRTARPAKVEQSDERVREQQRGDHPRDDVTARRLQHVRSHATEEEENE